MMKHEAKPTDLGDGIMARVECLTDDYHGVYVPQSWCQRYAEYFAPEVYVPDGTDGATRRERFERAQGDYDAAVRYILDHGHEGKYYWERWDWILDNVAGRMHSPWPGWRLYQDGGVFTYHPDDADALTDAGWW